MSHYNPKWMPIVGFIASQLSSLQLPMFGFILSKMVFTLMQGEIVNTSFEHDRDMWTLSFLALVTCIGVFTYLQKYMFGVGGENLTLVIRKKLFEGIIYKHIGWFDNKDKAPGVLNNMLQEDITTLNGLTTDTISILSETFLGLIISCIICFHYEWKLGIICTVLSPLLVMGGMFMSKLQFQ